MAISLAKGQKIDLSKSNPGLNLIRAGLGWAQRVTDGADFDLDASVIMLNADGKARSDKDFIYYNHPASTCESVKTNGDNRDGAGDGDDETISVKLSDVPADVARIQFIVSIHEAEERGQNFGQVKDAYIAITNEETKEQLVRFDLSEDFSTETGVVMGELYRHNGEWKFNAVGQGYREGLIAILKEAGLA